MTSSKPGGVPNSGANRAKVEARVGERGTGDAKVLQFPVAARARAQRRERQANTTGGRAKAHCVKVTPEQELELVARAARAKVSVSRLLVEAALSDAGSSVGASRDVADRLMGIERLLANVANNVNQIAVVANSGGTVDHERLSANMALLRRLRDRVDTALDGWSAAA
ncbi:plasmid mobilization relaxosome protein MobC [Nocardia uniformis]|uniref:Plasmid mobilization relaxosome protein MobC n=1 Tax=Nocardia uniformis TaxID=53432 RepID=A0A849C7I7_9NOCA|nr:plasmid mobilization relaxosome protein MobC [Nocardia uniformis]NNH73708.1 plasmid mobilization relaxosome protein MobC [Nocardia uniformis]